VAITEEDSGLEPSVLGVGIILQTLDKKEGRLDKRKEEPYFVANIKDGLMHIFLQTLLFFLFFESCHLLRYSAV
jgi:hypothetical protein